MTEKTIKSSSDEEDDASSVYSSSHERETDECHDTSDSDTYLANINIIRQGLISTSDESASGNKNATSDKLVFSDKDDTSGSEDNSDRPNKLKYFGRSMSSKNDDNSSDSSDSSTSSEQELIRTNNTECVKCRNVKTFPKFSLCHACFQERKRLLTPAPTSTRKRRRSHPISVPEKNSSYKRPRPDTPFVFGKKEDDNTSTQLSNNIQTTPKPIRRSNDESSDNNDDHGKSTVPISQVQNNQVWVFNAQVDMSAAGVTVFKDLCQKELETGIGELKLVVKGDPSASNSNNCTSLIPFSHPRKRESSCEQDVQQKRVKLELNGSQAATNSIDDQQKPECNSTNGLLINSNQSTKDSGISSNPSTPEPSTSIKAISNKQPNHTVTSNAGTSSNSQQDTNPSQNHVSQASSSLPNRFTTNLGLCVICMKNKKNAVFVHHKIVHLCCCYQCAIHTWKTYKRCPVCNGKIITIVKLFVA